MTSPDKDARTDFAPNNFLTSFFGTVKAVSLSPGPFYERMKTDGGFRNPLVFLICCVLIHTLAASLIFGNQRMIARNICFGIGMPFVTAGLLFLIITRLFRGSGTYEAAFRVNAYAAALNLVSWIPIQWAIVVIEIYRVYLIATGLSRTFSVKISRAVLAIVLTIIIYAALGSAVFHVLGPHMPTAGP